MRAISSLPRAILIVAFLSCDIVSSSGYALCGGSNEHNSQNSRVFKNASKSSAAKRTANAPASDSGVRYARKINLVYRPEEPLKTAINQQTPTPEGWEAYDGSVYTFKRGYGWLTNLLGEGRDRGTEGIVVLANGAISSPEKLRRPELANFQGRHGENRPLMFRIDLPDGWYRVSCASVDPSSSSGKPLVDQRSFKCRAHDVVFAGANYGPPTVVGGRQLVEGSGIVEVIDGHLRVVVGEPSYPGWVWSNPGPWYSDLRHWRKVEMAYAQNWWQRLTRTVDPGFHTLSLNSLQVERVPAPVELPALVFRDFFNRDDSSDVNAGVASSRRWLAAKPHPRFPDSLRTDLENTAIKVTGPNQGLNVKTLLQSQVSPGRGIVRYSTRVSLFTGEGSQVRSGTQEAGIVLLADPLEPSEFNSTFIGVRFDSSRSQTMGWLVYRVGNGRDGYRTQTEVADTALPFKITEGEYEIIVEHDLAKNSLTRVKINGVEVAGRWSFEDRRQEVSRGRFGVRSMIHNTNTRVNLQQFYWYYRVEQLAKSYRQ
jgi:hypothetical protein